MVTAHAIPLFPVAATDILSRGTILLIVAALAGILVVNLSAPRLPLRTRLWMGLALSPTISGGIVLAATVLFGASMPTAAFYLALAVAAGVVLYGALAPRRAIETPADAGWFPATLGLALLLALVIPIPHLLHPWIQMRTDAWFHAGVLREAEAHGFPPSDPFFHGLPLQYMWFYHLYLALVRTLVPVDPFLLMVLVNVLSVVILALGVYSISERLGLSSRDSFFAALTVPFALGALFYLFLPVRLAGVFVGEVRGAAALRELFPIDRIDVGHTRQFLGPFRSLPFFLNKFMVGTAYSVAVSHFLVFLFAWIAWLRTGGKGMLVLLFLGTAGMILFHPILATATLATTGLAAVLLVLERGPDRGPRARSHAAALGTALVALLVTLPYLLSCAGQKDPGQFVPFEIVPRGVRSILVGCLGVLLLAWWWYRSDARSRDPGPRLYRTWILAALFVSVIGKLPGPNTIDKFTHFLYLPFAIPAGWAIARLSRGPAGRKGRIPILAWALLFFLPASSIAYVGYLMEPDRRTPSRTERALFEYIEKWTPGTAVFLDTRMDLPVWAGRHLYWGGDGYAEMWGYHRGEMAGRRTLLHAVLSGAPIDTSTAEGLVAIGRPVYIVVRAGDDPGGRARAALGRDPYVEAMFSRPEVSLYRFAPEPRVRTFIGGGADAPLPPDGPTGAPP